MMKIEANYDSENRYKFCEKINSVAEKIINTDIEKIEASGKIEKKKENWLETIQRKLDGQDNKKTPIGKKIRSIQGKKKD